VLLLVMMSWWWEGLGSNTSGLQVEWDPRSARAVGGRALMVSTLLD